MRELDALVAEKVMGWNCDIGSSSFDMPTGKLPNFSTSISDAWLVVDAMRCDFMLRQMMGHGWECIFKLPDLKIGQADADTAPEAICRAALEAVNE